MAFFKRSDLEEQGFSKEQIDYLMAEVNRNLSASYILKSDVQAQIDEAVKAVKPPEPEPVDPKTTPEYMALAEERDMLRSISSDDFSSVKPKFREQVFKMLDRGENAPAVSEQLTGMKEKWGEFFIAEEAPKQQNTPQFSKDPGRSDQNPESEEDKLVKQLSENW